jgi:Kef-type K+ transport system membrane component KefB/nucleotide-binding universal stress UspA family protein
MPGFPATDPVLIFFIAMTAILAAPLVMQRLRGPTLVGMILAGTILGPSVLGLLERDATIVLLGTVGLLYLMFVAGVSIDLPRFERLRGWSIGFGLASFFIPQLAALAIATTLLGFSIPQALLLGSIVGSHTLLAFPIVDRLGIAENRGMIMGIGATIVTDLLSLMVLAIVIASLGGDTTTGFWVQFAALVFVWAAAAIWLLPRLGYWFFRNVRQGPAVDFSFLMVVLFLTAWLAGVVGLAPIIGAFVAGLLMNRLVPPQGPLMTRIKFVGDALLIPFFLLSVGMLIDVRVLVSSVDLWFLALTFTGLVVVGKTLAAKTAQMVLRQTSAEGWTVAGLTIPQAAATLAVTLVGFEVGLFSEMIVNAVVVMILLTSVIGPTLVERFGRQVALQETQRPFEPEDAPQRILVPLANPETAPALMDLAMALRQPGEEQPLYPLTVAREGAGEAAAVAASEQLLGHAVVHAAAADVPVVPITRVDHNVARGIVRAVRERRISTVVFGWEGEPGARALIFGSVLDQFLDESEPMVLVSRLVQPLAATERVVVLIPPLAEREVGFFPALTTLKFMTANAGAEMAILCLESSRPQVERWVERSRPEVNTTFLAMPAWDEALTLLESTVDLGDMICLVSTRRGTLTWRPDLMRLPRQIAARFRGHDFLTVYLSQQSPDGVAAAGERSARMPFLRESNVVMDVPDGTIEAVLARVLRQPGREPEAATRLAARIAAQQSDYAPELSPGLVLYHLHTGDVRRTQLCVGISREGVALPQTSEPARLILVLLAPLEMDPNAYLHQLALTAHTLHRPDLVARVVEAQTRADVVAAMLGRDAPAES